MGMNSTRGLITLGGPRSLKSVRRSWGGREVGGGGAGCNRLCVFLKVAAERQPCVSASVASVEAKIPRTQRIGETGCQKKTPNREA